MSGNEALFGQRKSAFSFRSSISKKGRFATFFRDGEREKERLWYTVFKHCESGGHGGAGLQIVICDDERNMQEILRDKIEKICRKTGVEHQILCCSSGEEVLAAKDAPDLLFLDIQMPDRDGMDVAQELRRRRWGTILIFVTALSEYVYDAFDVGAFHYLVKPFEDEKLFRVFEKAVEEYERRNQSGTGQGEGARPPKMLLIRQGAVSSAVPVDGIIYAEVFNRKVTLHTINGDMEYYGKLTELAEQVGEGFYRTHRAYLVNLDYVEKYDATTIWLEQGKALVSKKQFAGFVKQYLHYISRRGAEGWIR